MNVSKEDDLESLLKCYLLNLYGEGHILPKKKRERLSKECRDLFNAWMTHYTIEQFVSLPDYDAKVNFLLKCFRTKLSSAEADKIYDVAIPQKSQLTLFYIHP
jgi:hypothetical protein